MLIAHVSLSYTTLKEASVYPGGKLVNLPNQISPKVFTDIIRPLESDPE